MSDTALRVLAAMKSLPWRERRVLMYRFALDGHAPHTLEDVGRLMRLPRERIREIESAALERLSALLERSEDG